ncbi:hypothetical protein [Streptomyces sp. WM6349]|uniref:hypothetical protein n=1 Tax=Streptomyces sp. WM6349 TaxID=1415552 RepID=UPI000AB8728D|nr:hypothetical protein [Streptomyces sp. WM6349]
MPFMFTGHHNVQVEPAEGFNKWRWRCFKCKTVSEAMGGGPAQRAADEHVAETTVKYR